MNNEHLEKADKVTSSKIKFGQIVPKILLAVVAFGLLTLFIQLSGATNSFAAGCALHQFNNVAGRSDMCWRAVQQTNGRGSEAVGNFEFSNRGNGTDSAPNLKVVIGRQKFWCEDVATGSNGAATICNDHGVDAGDITLNIPPGQSLTTGNLSQAVGGNGQCGSAQIDFWIKSINGQSFSAGPYWAVAFLNRCSPPPPPPPPQTHKECRREACVVVSGAGSNMCQNNEDCQVQQNHYECRGLSCALVSGAGQNGCRPNTNDCVPLTHNVCRDNNSCARVVGPGRNECLSDSDCQTEQTHLECINEACRRVSGGGDNNCSSNSDCRPVVNQNVICDSLNVNPQSGKVSLSVSASLSGHTDNGGSVNNYRFNFGDGSGDWTQSGQTLSHTFTSTGTFVVNGYVIDNRGVQSGGSGSCQKVVTVSSQTVTIPPRGQVLGAIPSTGPADGVIISLLGTGTLGYFLRKLKLKS